MRVVIPLKDGGVVTTSEAQTYAFVELDESMQPQNIVYKNNFTQEFFEYIVTSKKDDNLDEAYELGARALLARRGMSVEEILEAMMFRELDEIV